MEVYLYICMYIMPDSIFYLYIMPDGIFYDSMGWRMTEFSFFFLGVVIAVSTVTVLTPVSCFYMTSFNYGAKKARDVGLTCRCHLSNIKPDSIFYDSMRWGMTQFFFLSGDNRCLQIDGFSLNTISPVGMGKT